MSVSAFNRRWGGGDPESFDAPRRAAHLHCARIALDAFNPGGGGENRAFIHHTHFDERGLGHLALGLAKASASRWR